MAAVLRGRFGAFARRFRCSDSTTSLQTHFRRRIFEVGSEDFRKSCLTPTLEADRVDRTGRREGVRERDGGSRYGGRDSWCIGASTCSLHHHSLYVAPLLLLSCFLLLLLLLFFFPTPYPIHETLARVVLRPVPCSSGTEGIAASVSI